MKKILFYRYGNICEPDLIECFARAGLDVTEERTQITKKDTSASETVETVSGLLRAESYLFVFSINFFPAVSETCRIFGLPYVCWTVDCPVMELWSDALRNDCNRVFFFDRVQYETFSPRMPTGCAFHLPLATNPDRWDDVIANAGETGLSAFRQEISFVGSLYSEKNRFRSVRESLRDYTKGYLEAVTQAQSRIYGCSLPEGLLTPDIVREFAEADPALQGPLYADNEQAKRAYITQMLLDWEITETERTRLLTKLHERCGVALYTHSDVPAGSSLRTLPGVKTLTEMPLVFHESKINLNITMRAIKSGLPLRVYDICGAGGFLLTNYQEELAEQYVIGEEVECFLSEEEMLDKASWYLAHPEERARIARKGYERTRAEHTYYHRMHAMMERLVNA